MFVRFLLTLATIASLTTVARGAPAVYLTWSQIPTTTISSEIQSFVTAGYATAGDQGAGCFYRRGASSDPGAVQSADGAWWGFDSTQIMYARCFGIFGSGDVTAAINSMMSQIGLFGDVQFDSQTYNVSSQVALYAGTIMGNGVEATKFNYTGSDCFLKLQGNFAKIQNFSITGPGSKAAGTSCGVQLGDSALGCCPRGQTVRDVSIRDMPTYGIDVVGSTNFLIDNDDIYDTGIYGIRVRNYGNADSGDSSISNSRILNSNSTCDGAAPTAIGNAGIEAITAAGLRIVGNKIFGFPNGIEYSQEDGKTSSVATISANSIENQCLSNIHLGMQGPLGTGKIAGLAITGNELLQTPSGTHSYNILIDGEGVDTVAITGNLLRGAYIATPPVQHGLYIARGTSIAVSGNVFNFLYSGIYFDPAASDRITVGTNNYDQVRYRLIDYRPLSSSPIDTTDVATVNVFSTSDYTNYWRLAIPDYRSANLKVTVSAIANGAGTVSRTVEVRAVNDGSTVTATIITDYSSGPPVDLAFDTTSSSGHVVVKMKRNSGDGASSIQGSISLARIAGNIQSFTKF